MRRPPDDIADEIGRYANHDQQNDKSGNAADHQGAIALGPQIVVIDAGTDDPTPRLEQRDVGDLFDRLRVARLRPHIFDEAGPVCLGDLDELDEESQPIRVLVIGEILAVEILRDRMHQHLRLQIVDPEIVVAVVAYPRDQFERALPGIGVADLARLGERMLAGHHGHHRIGQTLELLLPPCPGAVGHHVDQDGNDDDQADGGKANQAVEPCANVKSGHDFILKK
nr:hypothetical protein [Undibacter mobilis]